MKFKELLLRSGYLAFLQLLLGAIAVLLTAHMETSWHETHPTLLDAGRNVGLLLLSTGILTSLFEFFFKDAFFSSIRKELERILDPDAKRLGIVAIFKNRDELESRSPLRTFIGGAKKDLLIVAIGATRIGDNYLALLESLLQNGISIRILVQES